MVRGAACAQDLLCTEDSETFYVMGADKVWAADASRGNGGVMKLLQRWAQSELLALSTLDIELRAAHAANETDDDGE